MLLNESKQKTRLKFNPSYLSLLLLLLIGHSHAHWRHFTTTTRILFVLSLMINFGNPREVQTTKESKTLKDSGHT